MNINQLSGKLWYLSIFLLFVYFVFSLGGYYPSFKAQEKIRQKTIEEIKRIGSFNEPRVNTISSEKFIESMKKCIAYHNLFITRDNHIPEVLIIAQAIVESDYGGSRFAREGNNLFGIRVWSKNGILPLKQDASIQWRIKTYNTKCNSVKDYLDILNNNHHYSKFRQTRLRTKDPIKLAETLENYSTSQTYRTEIVRMINKIKDKI